MSLIDVHTHILSTAFTDLLAKHGGNRYQLATDSAGSTVVMRRKARFMTFTEPMFNTGIREKEMDEAGVTMGLISYTCPNAYWAEGDIIDTVVRTMNDHLAEVCAKWPSRYRGLASLPLQDTDKALAELERITKIPEMLGLIILANVNEVLLDDARFEPVWKELNRLRMPTLVHPTIPPGMDEMQMGDYGLIASLGFMVDTSLAISRMALGGVFERYPEWPVIVSHTGATLPFIAGRLDRAYATIPDARAHAPHPPSHYLARLYYDTVCYDVRALKLAYDLAGPERILYGSDYPHNLGDMVGCAQRIGALDIPAAEKELMRHGNARRLFGLG